MWFFPIPWIITGLVSLIGGGIAIAVTSSKKTEGKSLGVLGMKQAGKSRFLSNLGLFEYEETATLIKDYEKQIVKLNNRVLEIQAGQDVGGDVDIRGYYNQWVGEKDITIFIFDGAAFLSDPEYGSRVRARLHFIHNTAKRKLGEQSDYKNIVIIASHSDQYGKGGDEAKKDMLEKIIDAVKDRKYADLMRCNFFASDLRNKKEVMEIANQIF